MEPVDSPTPISQLTALLGGGEVTVAASQSLRKRRVGFFLCVCLFWFFAALESPLPKYLKPRLAQGGQARRKSSERSDTCRKGWLRESRGPGVSEPGAYRDKLGF